LQFLVLKPLQYRIVPLDPDAHVESVARSVPARARSRARTSTLNLRAGTALLRYSFIAGLSV
jgi:hypothetical protein